MCFAGRLPFGRSTESAAAGMTGGAVWLTGRRDCGWLKCHCLCWQELVTAAGLSGDTCSCLRVLGRKASEDSWCGQLLHVRDGCELLPGVQERRLHCWSRCGSRCLLQSKRDQPSFLIHKCCLWDVWQLSPPSVVTSLLCGGIWKLKSFLCLSFFERSLLCCWILFLTNLKSSIITYLLIARCLSHSPSFQPGEVVDLHLYISLAL